MRRWFTTYIGPNPNPKTIPLTPLFQEQVRKIVSDTNGFPYLEKAHSGTYVRGKKKAFWKHVEVPEPKHINDIYVLVESFRFGELRPSQGDYTPVFRLKIIVALANPIPGAPKPETIPFVPGRAPGKIIFNDEIMLEFPPNYPQNPPWFRLDNPAYTRLGTTGFHHVHDGGVLCIMSNSTDWNPALDSIIRAIYAALDWVAWHYEEHGWVDPDEARRD